MYTGASDAFNTAVSADCRTFAVKLEYPLFTIETDAVVSMTVNGGSCGADSLTIGSAVSAGCELQIVSSSNIITGVEFNAFIGVTLPDDSVEYIPFGVYSATEAKTQAGITTITASDRMITRGSKLYESSLIFPSDSIKMLNELCSQMGCGLATSGLTAIAVKKRPVGYTRREMMGYIAALYGRFACFDRTGNVEIRWYSDSGLTIDYDRIDVPELAESDYLLKWLRVINPDNTIMTAGSYSNTTQGITISHPFMTQAALNTAWNTIKNFSYRSADIKLILGDPRIDPWDIVTVQTDTETINVPVMNLNFDFDGGLMTQIGAVEKTETENGIDYKGPKITENERVHAELMSVSKALIGKADVTELNAAKANITTLNTQVANITTIMAGSIGTGSLQTIHLTAQNATVADEFAVDILAAKISVGDLKSGTISTNKFDIRSDSGKLILSDNTLQISDNSRVRVQIGKDGTGDYSMYVWDSAGNLMFDALGLHEHGIKSGIIRNDMVAENAAISGGKIDMESLFSTMNGSVYTIKSSKVFYDDAGQTLDVAFKSLSTDVDGIADTVTAQGTQISAVQGQISQKIWQDDISTAVDGITPEITSLKNRCSDIEQTADGITQTVTGIQSDISENYSTTEQMNAAIELKADGITQSVSKTIDEMSIGGRNLILNSSGNLGDTSNWSPTSGLSVRIVTDDGVHGQNSVYLIPSADLTARSLLRQTVTDRLGMADMKFVTLSFWYRASSQSISSGLGAFIRLTSSTGNKDVLVSTGKLTADWKWRKCTMTADLSQYAGTYTGAILHLCAFGGNVRYSCIKLESGNKPTEWTPAPEDSDAKITSVESKIRQTADSITAQVDDLTNNVQAQLALKVGADDNGKIISMINAAADEITLEGGAKINISTPGKLLISAGNFQLDEKGNVTANAAKLTNAKIGGELTCSVDSGLKTEIAKGQLFQYCSNNLIFTMLPVQGRTGGLGPYFKTGIFSCNSSSGLRFGHMSSDGTETEYYRIDMGKDYDTYRHVFSGRVRITDETSISKLNVSNSYSMKDVEIIRFVGSDIYIGNTNNALRLIGSSVTSNGSAVTSDRRMKHDIADMDEKYLKMLDVLSAKTFRYNEYQPDKTNCGFIAQDVLSALDDVGLTAKEFGGFVDVNGDGSEFALDYSQFVPILWAAVKDIKSKINGGM